MRYGRTGTLRAPGSRLLAGITAAVAISLAAAACSSSASSSADTSGTTAGSKLTNVTLGIYSLASGPSAPYTYAVEDGIFKKHGLNVTLQFVGSSSNTTELLEAGKIDIGLTAASTVISSVGQGTPLQMFMGEFQREADGFITRTSEHITSLQALKGKTVALNPAASSYAVLPAVLAKAGMTESDLKISKTTQSGLHSTFAADRADAIIANPYSLIPSFDANGVQSSEILFSNYIDFLGDGFVAPTSTLKKDPTMISEFVAAVREAFKDSMANPTAAVQSLVKMEGAAAAPSVPVAVKQLTQGFTYLHTKNTEGDPIGVMSAADWKSSIALSAQSNHTSPGISPGTVFTNEFVEAG